MHRTEIAAFLNQKGGVGKTTSVVNIGAGLTILGKRVLIVDLDPQGHLTTIRILFDRLIGESFTPRAIMEPMAHGASWWKIASAILLVILVVWSFYRTRVLQKTFIRIVRRLGLSR